MGEDFRADAGDMDFRDATSIDEIPLDRIEDVCLGYLPPRQGRRYCTGRLLQHDKEFVYIGQDFNFEGNASDLHFIGRLIAGVTRIKKEHVDRVLPLETRVSYKISK